MEKIGVLFLVMFIFFGSIVAAAGEWDSFDDDSLVNNSSGVHNSLGFDNSSGVDSLVNNFSGGNNSSDDLGYDYSSRDPVSGSSGSDSGSSEDSTYFTTEFYIALGLIGLVLLIIIYLFYSFLVRPRNRWKNEPKKRVPLKRRI